MLGPCASPEPAQASPGARAQRPAAAQPPGSAGGARAVHLADLGAHVVGRAQHGARGRLVVREHL